MYISRDRMFNNMAVIQFTCLCIGLFVYVVNCAYAYISGTFISPVTRTQHSLISRSCVKEWL